MSGFTSFSQEPGGNVCGFIVVASTECAIDRDILNIARDTMFHYPLNTGDSKFFFRYRVVLGRRRLSIIGLIEACNQTMHPDFLRVVFNGEIYKFSAFRRELTGLSYHFRRHFDTEILLHADKAWVKQLCGYLEGMSAFAIYEKATGNESFSQDPVGQDPYEIMNRRKDWYNELLWTWTSSSLPDAVLYAPIIGLAMTKGRNAEASLSGRIQNVSQCVDAGRASPNAWPESRRKKKLLWQGLQVQHMSGSGFLS
jgi:hypothetical protein